MWKCGGIDGGDAEAQPFVDLPTVRADDRGGQRDRCQHVGRRRLDAAQHVGADALVPRPGQDLEFRHPPVGPAEIDHQPAHPVAGLLDDEIDMLGIDRLLPGAHRLVLLFVQAAQEVAVAFRPGQPGPGFDEQLQQEGLVGRCDEAKRQVARQGEGSGETSHASAVP
ncbi:hypothetical protein ACIU1J_31255 [Azospirillum doebereinerae]|uniref:hypothetical protein n=1 Tax=Azospirillum doebereinerae TaxID=92933 RepID=UPI00384FEC95